MVDAPLRWWLPVAATYEVAEHCIEKTQAGMELFKVSGPEVIPNACSTWPCLQRDTS